MPFVHQIFLSEEEAYSFYKRYAYQHGFSVLKGRFVKRNGIINRHVMSAYFALIQCLILSI